MGEDGDSVAYFLAVIILLGLVGPSIPASPEGQIVNPFSCRTLEGVIIDKEHDEEGQRLYVELFIKDEWEGYTYTKMVCELVEYEEILSFYDDGIDSGWLAPASLPTIASS